MCGRYSLTTETDLISERFVGHSLPGARLPARGARYSIAPAPPVWVLVDGEEPMIVALQWGLIPAWATTRRLATA